MKLIGLGPLVCLTAIKLSVYRNAKPQLGIGNLPDSAKVLEWIPVNDRVMGGASTSQTTAMADGMAFSGVVSLDLAC